MPIIKFKEKTYNFEEKINGFDVLNRLKEDYDVSGVIALKKDNEIIDLMTNIDEDSKIELVTKENKESLFILRHTASHILAQALLRLYPDKIKLAIGPSTDEGFYYDFDSDIEITEEDLRKIEEEMSKIMKEGHKIEIVYLSTEKALDFYSDNEYKRELINDIISKENPKYIKFYKQGEFMDLCKGPHLPRTSFVKAFKLDKITKAYWKGNSNNKQLYRIYGFSFWTNKELNEYLNFLEEAKKRDHRIIGKKMDLFSISDFSPGMPFFHNKGMIIWDELLKFWENIHKESGYELIKTPILLNRKLWEISGHWNFYKENMYLSKIDDMEYAIKPMNCPGCILIYKNKIHSYKDLPVRMGEIGLVHRHELSGTLSGLFRVRAFHQDDAHIFMRADQIEEEILGVLKIIDKIYNTFNLDYHLELSTRPEKSIGSDEIWNLTETKLKEALNKFGKGYKLNEGDGAFYGPKIDVHLKDSIGRTHQCATVQLDMNLPERFDIYYINEKDEKVRPVMIHRVIYGSFERFFGILIEHFEGKFPLWLSPVQIKILNLNENQIEYCNEVMEILIKEGFRVELDTSRDKISKKILRTIEYEKPNYIIILGDNEVKNKTLSVRTRKIINNRNETFNIDIEKFIERIKKERDEKLIY